MRKLNFGMLLQFPGKYLMPKAKLQFTSRQKTLAVGPTKPLQNIYQATNAGAGLTIAGSKVPLLDDGGIVTVDAGLYNMQNFGYIDDTMFPNGITIQGAGANKTILYSTSLASRKGVLLTSANLTLTDLAIQGGMNNIQANDGSAGLYMQNMAGSTQNPRTVTLTRIAFDANANGIFSPDSTLLTGAGWNLVVDHCDFGRTSPNGLTKDWSSHDINTGADLLVTNSNFYGPKFGANIRVHSKNVTIKNSYLRRGPNWWVDMPNAGVFTSENNTYISLPISKLNIGKATDSILHLLEYGTTDTSMGATNPSFTQDEIWITRKGETILLGDVGLDKIKFVFSNVTQRWSNVNNATPYLVPARLGHPIISPSSIVDGMALAPTPNLPYDIIPPDPPPASIQAISTVLPGAVTGVTVLAQSSTDILPGAVTNVTTSNQVVATLPGTVTDVATYTLH